MSSPLLTPGEFPPAPLSPCMPIKPNWNPVSKPLELIETSAIPEPELTTIKVAFQPDPALARVGSVISASLVDGFIKKVLPQSLLVRVRLASIFSTLILLATE